ncbi:PREDICTED: probable E3 ubiquitin-protein ligase RHY1A isoform X2 [Ipomoea nil]|uniref:probable E3 ubiquitin-protein ligase RHY1A isoform X2 n=1 Tax=Ipomoea nil TaxID=35883 RepID=UPI000900FB9D|nr:PREDICTED: probable E3 ubiquitin-protein ligase RHY1A isoform X2 [Ipomoea nil]
MAGMLPGVECARRRRFHQSGGLSDSTTSTTTSSSTRRSSFCLYTSNHDSHLSSSSSSSSMQRSTIGKAYQDEKLGAAAREAKERLDERLKSGHCKSDHKRNCRKTAAEKGGMVMGDVQMLKSKAMKWAKKLGWKASEEEEECAICLDHFKVGETLMQLPCSHRFHSRCLLPWLDTNAHCPCCRMGILSSPF